MENLLLIKKLDQYRIISKTDYINALRETIQYYLLFSLSKQNFFDHAVFYGGTCLRIIKNINRYSEDLDFVLVNKLDKSFDLYIKNAVEYLSSLGLEVTYLIKDLNNKFATEVLTCYIKIDLNGVRKIVNKKYQFKFTYGHPLYIKVDLSTTPVQSSKYEFAEADFPENYKVRILNYPSMFAGKLCAILNRHYKFRVKGRDYFDYMYYVNNDISINLDYINEKLNSNLSFNEFKKLLKKKFEEVDFNKICYDLRPFINPNYNLENLNNDNLLKTIDKLTQYK